VDNILIGERGSYDKVPYRGVKSEGYGLWSSLIMEQS
jgi:hypothetical protein